MTQSVATTGNVVWVNFQTTSATLPPILQSSNLSEPQYSSFTYDQNGNTVNDTRIYFEYGANNMLKRLRNAQTGEVVEDYWYNPSGDRVKKVAYLVDGRNRTTLYVNSGYEVEVNESGVK
jgi:hypothetical protein